MGRHTSEPTFVDGIGPPLEQLEQDYRELLDGGTVCDWSAKDVLALIREVKRAQTRLLQTNDDRAHWRDRAIAAEQALGLYGPTEVWKVAEDLLHLLEGAQMHALVRSYRERLATSAPGAVYATCAPAVVPGPAHPDSRKRA